MAVDLRVGFNFQVKVSLYNRKSKASLDVSEGSHVFQIFVLFTFRHYQIVITPRPVSIFGINFKRRAKSTNTTYAIVFVIP